MRTPIRSHDAITAQHTGATTAGLLSPNMTGNQEELSSAKTGEEGVSIEPDLYACFSFGVSGILKRTADPFRADEAVSRT